MRYLAFALAISCSQTQVQRQATAAHETAISINTIALPALEAAYRAEQYSALQTACSDGCDRAEALGAVLPVRQRWDPVWASAEAVRLAHGVWADELEICRRLPLDGGVCGPSVAEASVRVVRAILVYRCSLRAAGESGLDKFTGDILCP